MATPVTKRRTNAGPGLSTQSAMAPLAAAPRIALTTIRRRGERTSGRLPRALTSVPAMKPIWTELVRLARPASPSCHSAVSAGSTADALNQSDSAISSAADSRASCRQRSAVGSDVTRADTMPPRRITAVTHYDQSVAWATETFSLWPGWWRHTCCTKDRWEDDHEIRQPTPTRQTRQRRHDFRGTAH